MTTGTERAGLVPRFTLTDADRAYDEWGANCGPNALAAVNGRTLDEVRPHLGEFEAKGYTNPTMMYEALDRLGVRWRYINNQWPKFGLVRVQWEGPWMNPGVPIRARYGHTHWIGHVLSTRSDRLFDRGVFDVNCLSNGTGWTSLHAWESLIVPFLTSLHKRATGKWHITHGIEIT